MLRRKHLNSETNEINLESTCYRSLEQYSRFKVHREAALRMFRVRTIEHQVIYSYKPRLFVQEITADEFNISNGSHKYIIELNIQLSSQL
jgi:hypothetical protein